MEPAPPPARTHSIHCPLLNPFEKGLLVGRERMELAAVCVMLAVFVAAMIALINWMALTLPAG